MFRAFLSFLGRPRLSASRQTRQVYRARTLPVSFRPLLETLEDRVVPTAVYHVTDGASLAAAVQTADSQHVAAEIILDRAGTYNLSSALTISTNLTITGSNGNNPGQFVIEPASGKTERLFTVSGASQVAFEDLVLQGGSTSGNGGALDVETTGASVELDNVVVQNNKAGGDGGGVYVADGAALSSYGSLFRDNTATGSGGGVYFNASSQAAQVALTWTTFTGNKTGSSDTSDGRGILVQATTPSDSSSTALPPRVDSSVNYTTFVNNQAGHDGGGMWNNDVTNLQADHVYAQKNTCVDDSGALGLSVMHLNSASFSLTNSYVDSNQTTGPGSTTTPDAGGVCFDFQAKGANTPTGQVSANIAYNVFSNNSVAGAGGGVFLRDDAAHTTFNARVFSNLFASNHATSSNISGRESGSGGGIYVDAAAASNAVGLGWNTFSGNTADNDGGGLFLEIDSGTANISAGAFRSNQATNGGGAYLAGSTDGSKGGTVIVSQDVFYSNSASTDGGGLYVDKPITARLGGDVLVSNRAGAAGGGLYNNSDGTIMAANTLIYGNSAPSGPNVFGSFSNSGGWGPR